MEFIEGSGCTYRPIKVLFEASVYEQTLQICWHAAGYKSKIAVMTELLRLQQNNLLPPTVTAGDMADLLVEESKRTLREQLWKFQLENFDEDEARPLLKLVWQVNTSMKMRDVEFEARRLLSCPEKIPPQFRHPKIISQAWKYAECLTQRPQASAPRLLGPHDVVVEVVPRVLQGFWGPPADTHLSAPSRQLSRAAVCVTKAVLDLVSAALSPAPLPQKVAFSRSVGEALVLGIQGKVWGDRGPDALAKGPDCCYTAQALNAVAEAAAGQICALFEPQSHCKD